MKPIRILIIDDQYARDDFLRLNLITTTGITESGAKRPAANGIEAVFCSGQSVDGNAVKNDYGVIADAVAQGWGEDAVWQWNLVLLDVRFDSGVLDRAGKPKGGREDDKFGLSVRNQLRDKFPDLPVVMFSGKHEAEINDSNDSNVSQQHYLSKEGINQRELKRVLLDYGRLGIDQARQLLGISDGIVFASKEMIKVYRDAYLHAENDQPILILGESGSGKEGLAKCIHQMSSRSKAPYVPFNSAAIPEGLVESILFGTVRGAYPGAIDTGGLFEEADGGSLFLDEIGDMALPLQSKILRAIQEKKVRRVGGRRDIDVDVRLISATHWNLETRIIEKEFRSDLFYRIRRGATITVPPLRDRRADIAPLTEFFLAREMKDRGKVGICFSESAKHKLKQYDFPGNVRDLESTVTELVGITGNNRVIDADDVILSGLKGTGEQHVTWEEVHSELSASPATAGETNANPLPMPVSVNLSNLHEVIATLPVESDDSALRGIKPRLEQALKELIQRCAGAALERCKDPLNEEYPLQPAMQLLKGDTKLTSTGPKRLLNEVLGRNLETNIQEVDKQNLVEVWKNQGR